MLDLLFLEYSINISVEHNFLLFKKNKTYNITFKEPTILEVLEYQKAKLSTYDIRDWVVHFVIENSNEKLSKRAIKKIVLNTPRIISILDNIFSAETEKVSSPPTWESWTPWWPIIAYLLSIARSLKIDLLCLLNTYSFRLLSHVSQWLAWNGNEISEDGQKRNRLWLEWQENKKNVEKNKEEIDKIFNILNNK